MVLTSDYKASVVEMKNPAMIAFRCFWYTFPVEVSPAKADSASISKVDGESK